MTGKIILEFLIGCFLSIVGFVCFFVLFFLFEYYLDVEIFFGGDKANVFCGLFLGIPIGVLVGISLVDKLVFPSQGYNIYGIVAALILSQLGVILGIWLLDTIGGKAIFLIPFIVTCFSIIGYNSILLIR